MVIIMTLFFLMPVTLLYYITVRNFINNRTTNERFTGKNPITHKNSVRERTLSVAEAVNSSISLNETLIETKEDPEDIIKEFGAPQDFGNTGCEKGHNFLAMCCHREIPNQRVMYEALKKN